jgi:V/A-type H+-transporting ATPase subunit E
VQELIDRLRDEGVSKGRREADALLAEARKKAAEIIDDARKESDRILTRARREAENTRTGGEEALRLAARDAVLSLRESLGEDFTNRVRRLVSHTLQDQEFLKRLILEVAQRAMPDDAGRQVEVLLPENVVTLEDLQRDPEDVAEGTLTHFVLGLAGDIVREGLSFKVADDDTPGVRIRLADEDIEIELTDATISALLMRHLVPRFRAIMERHS